MYLATAAPFPIARTVVGAAARAALRRPTAGRQVRGVLLRARPGASAPASAVVQRAWLPRVGARGFDSRALLQQSRGLHQTRPLHAHPAVAFASVWIAKKTVVFLAASLFGFKRLYRRMHRLNIRWAPRAVQAKTQWLLRHSFDVALKLANKLDFRAKATVERKGAAKGGK